MLAGQFALAVAAVFFGAAFYIKLMAVDPVNADPSSRKLIEKWARLHAVRTILGFAATLIFVYAALR